MSLENNLRDYFSRLLCFEQRYNNYLHPAEAVGDIFRALFTVISNDESTVITPLLATGNQVHIRSSVCSQRIDLQFQYFGEKF